MTQQNLCNISWRNPLKLQNKGLKAETLPQGLKVSDLDLNLFNAFSQELLIIAEASIESCQYLWWSFLRN